MSLSKKGDFTFSRKLRAKREVSARTSWERRANGRKKKRSIGFRPCHDGPRVRKTA